MTYRFTFRSIIKSRKWIQQFHEFNNKKSHQQNSEEVIYLLFFIAKSYEHLYVKTLSKNKQKDFDYFLWRLKIDATELSLPTLQSVQQSQGLLGTSVPGLGEQSACKEKNWSGISAIWLQIPVKERRFIFRNKPFLQFYIILLNLVLPSGTDPDNLFSSNNISVIWGRSPSSISGIVPLKCVDAIES